MARPYVGVVSDPLLRRSFAETKRRTSSTHARLVDAELLGEIADQIGADVNVFDGGELVATSREGLLSGGFISSDDERRTPSSRCR